ncbi:hypothetical protein FDP41_009923 [Naegleria fowleri]|uniref:Matrin-type domain-containing protein n=1 Tax=Naegleria fowleri TaxID=5763 RepID=A0A6A5BC84_NAEFO|nr:uncharacterized protein FDP41_009923 [Naegleria fowleri]KAF0971700.1 hypothetical protein FDP41_009923 [Naegleria fowleri]CAG4710082.1 unnamed protein product [Naegleria fowleri]
MSNSLLVEQARLSHVDIEQAIKSVVYEIKHRAKTQKHMVYQNHRLNYHLQQIQEKAQYLKENIYGVPSSSSSDDHQQHLQQQPNSSHLVADTNGSTSVNSVTSAESDQLKSMRAQLTETTFPNTISSFYSRLAEIREYHKKFAVKIENRNTSESSDEQLQNKIRQRVQNEIESGVVFTDEELYGRYVDLHAHYNAFLDLINEKPLESVANNVPTPVSVQIDYMEYLNTIGQFEKISLDVKNREKYKTYLEGLLAYFIDFMTRTQPLMNIQKMIRDVEEDFDKNWREGNVSEAWAFLKPSLVKQQGEQNNAASHQQQQQNSQQAVNNHGVQQQPPQNSAEQKKKKRRGGKRKSLHNVDKMRALALLETKISKFLQDWLADVIQQTKVNVEKKSTRTWEENQAELERIEKQMDLEDDEEYQRQQREKRAATENPDDPLSKYASKKNNPLNLPIGPDGKPIPYWLYKWQGLGNEYICEICGNHSYWGHREFEKHFQEWRHANGMKCLGIPNTRHFHHITKIKDALDLWNNMQQQVQQQHWDDGEMEEVEDEEGNVYTKQTYIDLKKQGYIKESSSKDSKRKK